jgi:PKD repeat protein
MDLAVVETPFTVEPIDSLQVLFDAFVAAEEPSTGFAYSAVDLQVTFSDSSNAAAWDWDFGDGFSQSVQNPEHTYTTVGTYNVCLTVRFACFSEIYCDSVTVTTTGIREYAESKQLSVYPNPSGATFTVTSREALKGAVLTVLNEAGVEVIRMDNIKGKMVTLNLQGLPKGFYLLCVSGGAVAHTESIILE